MATPNKISSNVTGLSYAEEKGGIGVLGSSTWYGLEPNSYSDFGGKLTLLSRNPITAGRQRKKGVITDLEASGGFNTDLTQDNLQDLLQGFFFADLRKAYESTCTAVDDTPTTFAVPSLTGVVVGDMIKTTGFTNAANNSANFANKVFYVSAVGTGLITTNDSVTLVAETPPVTAKVEVVGHKFGAGVLDVVIDGAGWPTLTSSAADFVTLGFKVGQWIYVGGDSAQVSFLDSANNGFKRIKAVAAGVLTLDKSDSPMTGELSTSETIVIWYGRMLNNRTGTSIVRRSYQLERNMGSSDTADATKLQYEYIVGAVPNKFAMAIAPSTKITCDLDFVAKDFEQYEGVTANAAMKAGTSYRSVTTQADAFNTSSDFSRIHLALITSGTEAPASLYAFVTDLSISIDNGITPDKAVGVLGAFDMSEGDFVVTGSMTAYFSDMAAVAAVRNNSNVTLDFAVAKNNAGIVVDIPLLALGDGRLNVEKDKAVTIPLSFEAATASAIDAATDYTLCMCFFNFLPSAAEA
jgi:hypothetical protein